MTKEQRDFYMENQGFIIDIKDYYKIIRKEFYYIINEVGGHTLKCEYFYIGMIPFKPNINGILLDNENIIKFECDDIRAEIGSGLPLFKEIFEFEQQNALYYEENELNIKKCEIYYESKRNFPFICRHGGQGNPSGHKLIQSKMEAITNNNNSLFVSNWVEFGPFCIFFVSKLNEEVCLKYWELANTRDQL